MCIKWELNLDWGSAGGVQIGFPQQSHGLGQRLGWVGGREVQAEEIVCSKALWLILGTERHV